MLIIIRNKNQTKTHDVKSNLESSATNKSESKVDASSNDDATNPKGPLAREEQTAARKEKKQRRVMYTPSGEFIRTPSSCWSAADADDGFAVPITELCVKLGYSANDLFQIYEKFNSDCEKTLQHLKELELKKNSETTIPG